MAPAAAVGTADLGEHPRWRGPAVTSRGGAAPRAPAAPRGTATPLVRAGLAARPSRDQPGEPAAGDPAAEEEPAAGRAARPELHGPPAATRASARVAGVSPAREVPAAQREPAEPRPAVSLTSSRKTRLPCPLNTVPRSPTPASGPAGPTPSTPTRPPRPVRRRRPAAFLARARRSPSRAMSTRGVRSGWGELRRQPDRSGPQGRGRSDLSGLLLLYQRWIERQHGGDQRCGLREWAGDHGCWDYLGEFLVPEQHSGWTRLPNRHRWPVQLRANGIRRRELSAKADDLGKIYDGSPPVERRRRTRAWRTRESTADVNCIGTLCACRHRLRGVAAAADGEFGKWRTRGGGKREHRRRSVGGWRCRTGYRRRW